MRTSTPPLLTLYQATLVQNGVRILDNLSLQIPDGQHCALFGPNGSGKSSLIRLITHQWYPLAHADSSPSVSVFGKSRWNIFALRALLGIVSSDLHQGYAADPDRRGLELVLSGFFASHGLADYHKVTPAMHQAAERALALMEATPLADKPVSQMSTGQARRVLIARALAHAPRALLLDEPTAGLDLAAARRFLQTLRHLAQSGTTVLLVTHHVEEILPEINRVILLRHGTVFFDGPKSEALTSARLSALYDAPITVMQTGGYYSAHVTDAFPPRG